MVKKTLPDDTYTRTQLNRFAEDLATVYRSEKEKRKELQLVNQQLEAYANDLNTSVADLKAANLQLKRAYFDTINRLVLAAEFKDENTGEHIIRMSRYSALLVEKLGFSPGKVVYMRYAASMHDIGKMGIPDRIMLKPGKLTEEEFKCMKAHTTIGTAILADSKSELLNMAQEVALSHHEKWNGSGYPQGLSGNKIPIFGRIVGLTDVFDALTSKRPYKKPYPLEVACDIIRKERGEHFDPDLVDIFLKDIDEFSKIKEEVNSGKDRSQAAFVISHRDPAAGVPEV